MTKLRWWIAGIFFCAIVWLMSVTTVVHLWQCNPIEPMDINGLKEELYQHQRWHARADRIACDTAITVNEYEEERDPYRPLPDPAAEMGCEKCHNNRRWE